MSKSNYPFLLLPLLVAAILSLAACKTPTNLVYFQDLARDTTLQNTVTRNFDLKIKPDDLLYIGVTSASTEQSALFNAPQVAAIGGGTGGGTTSGYLVDKKGTVQIYKLGDVRVAGLTRIELKEQLQRDLSPYLKEPIVTVRFLSNKITVLGEVNRPGVIPIASDQLTLVEALGQSGDLKGTARRDNILVIRQTENGKEFRRLNILEKSVFNSPHYYLQNEDVVYVEPDLQRPNVPTAQLISYIISGASLLVLVIDRFLR